MEVKSIPATVFSPTVLLAFTMMAIVIMMVLPVPAWILDAGLTLSFSLAILMFTTTLFVERPLEFSAFPTILLISLILRLSLNVSSTKLIIGEGHTGVDAAGSVIEGFANFIMMGNLLLGIVVFGVLMIVNFVVITKGAGRMAEVGARFALDSMPGKQLSIDGDMAAGAITHLEAKERRERELAETNFFGSLDGASKFVKGDAIAGLLITALNIIVGVAAGITIHGLPPDVAFKNYTILTIGDGLVNQIPAVIISISAAILLTRGGNSGAADVSIFQQLRRYPAALGTVSALMFVFAVIPGMPFLSFFGGSVLLACFALHGYHRDRTREPVQMLLPEIAEQKRIGDVLDFNEIHIEFAPNLVGMALDVATGLDVRIQSMRVHIAKAFGVILPEIRLTDNTSLKNGMYCVKLQGVEYTRNTLYPDKILVLHSDGVAAPDGIDVKEPVYGAPARWIDLNLLEQAALSGLTTVTPPEVLATHLLEILKGNLPRLLGRKGIKRLLNEFVNVSDVDRSEENRNFLSEIIPDKVSVDLLLSVLKLLLEEGVSIRNLPYILEAIVEARALNAPELICEHVRFRLGFQITADLVRPDGTVPLVQLAPDWEKVFATYQIESDRGSRDIALPHHQFNKLTNDISKSANTAMERGQSVALITSSLRRRFLYTALNAKGIKIPVLSYDELGVSCKPSIVDVIAA